MRSPTIAASLIVLAATLEAQIVVEPPTQVTALSGDFGLPFATVVLGDFDDDQVLDIVQADGELFGHRLRTWLGNGDGTFVNQLDLPLPERMDVLATGHFDGDTDLDLLVGLTTPFPDGLLLQRGLGDGTFGPGTPVGIAGILPGIVHVVDLDGDEDLDIVSDNNGFPFIGSIDVLLGNGDGTFDHWTSIPKLIFDGTASDLGFLDGDDTLDIARTTSTAALMLHLGVDGGSEDPRDVVVPIQSTANAFSAVRIADVDGDLDDDILVLAGDHVVVMPNNGVGKFPISAQSSIQLGFVASDMEIGDLDQDGTNDIVLTEANASTTAFLRARGDGTFRPPLFVSNTERALNPRVGDLDNDGFPDVTVTGQVDVPGATNTLSVLRNHTYAPDAPFLDFGIGQLAGTTGYPVLLCTGTLVPGEPWEFAVFNALPGANANYVFGTSTGFMPFNGGVLVPIPERITHLTVKPLGKAEVGNDSWGGIVSGFQFFIQYWIQDPAGVQGWSASSAVQVTNP